MVKLLVSTKTTLLLFLLFASSMAIATFIENDHGTQVARGIVYEAWWFEVLMGWMGINFIFHFKKYKLYRQKKWPVGLFHLAFICILLGAGITRYFSTEGTMRIREGEASSVFYSSGNYLQLEHPEVADYHKFEKSFSLLTSSFSPEEHLVNFPDLPSLTIRVDDYVPGARKSFLSGNQDYLDIAVALGSGRKDYLLKSGEALPLGGLLLATGAATEAPIRLFQGNDGWKIESAVHLQVMDMASQQMHVLHEGETQPLHLRSLYQWEGGAFLVKAIHENTSLQYESEADPELAKNLPDVVKLSARDQQGNLLVDGFLPLVQTEPQWLSFTHEGNPFRLTFGPKAVTLPFELYLNAFELERYPGSQSPASYASEVMVMEAGTEFPYRIFMNNVLDHKGYRFYQSSYDQDEKGTVLTVNQDRLGTYTSYLGYFLLFLGMLLTLFTRGSRFQLLNKKLKNLDHKKNLAMVFLLGPVVGGFAQDASTDIPKVPEEKALAYGRLIVQDMDGRMKPLNTLALEITRKLTGKTNAEVSLGEADIRLSPEQLVLGVQLNPELYQRLPLLKIDREKSAGVFQTLQVAPAFRLSFQDFIDDEGNYLLYEQVEAVNRLKPSERSEADNELLKTDERFNIFYGLLTGDFLRLYPNKLDPDNTWFTKNESRQGFTAEDARFVANIGTLYLEGLREGMETGDWNGADEALSYMDLFQREAGKSVYPASAMIKGELLYNKLRLGSRLFGPFWLIGFVMLVLGIARLFYRASWLKKTWKAGLILTWLGWGLFTFHLALRWYIAQHPPWSDGFEMLVFVAWGILFFSLVFSGKSKFTIPLGLLFSGTLLFVGFLDWLNPEITNLMPVLHSYWLKIHVAIIVSGYAPLALAAILALLSLLLMIFKPKSPRPEWWKSMLELNVVNELALTVGLFLLTIGTFLGGIWANESWGRYWAWDPKETWALISIMVYAFVLHLRLVPALKNALVFNLASLWAFSSIIMTSFGVNYYLSGLHSYAAGDPVPVPTWVYVVTGILLVISIATIYSFRNWSTREKKRIIA